MIYFDSSALLKFVKPEKESQALRTWRLALEPGTELVASRLAALEISRTLLRAGVDRERVPYVVGQALSATAAAVNVTVPANTPSGTASSSSTRSGVANRESSSSPDRLPTSSSVCRDPVRTVWTSGSTEVRPLQSRSPADVV